VSATRTEELARVLVPIGLGMALVGGLYVFGTQHTPNYNTSLFGQTAADTLPLKSWLATALLALAAGQLGLALWIYGRLPGIAPGESGIATTHRALGVIAILVSLPIAYHCAFAYGIQTHIDTRIAVHSIAGCFLYGAVVAKLLIVRLDPLGRWILPLAGGTVVVLVAVLWYTSALWYFDGYSLPSL
jgi:hypothetical protein